MAAATDNAASAHSAEEIMREMHTFVAGATLHKVTSTEVVRSALFLLRNLPAARHGVLEHLCNVFDEAVNHHILQIEIGKSSAGDANIDMDSIIMDIQSVLMVFVRSNSDAWAPIISAWAIELLGQISSTYADRRGVPHSSNLNELLQLWMTCTPTKVLIEIASECFASMVGDAPDVCVDALLEASVKHSPHFDWVVAHIGSCFPTTIITRVLMCGLKDYCLHGNSQSDTAMVTDEKVPKMESVVGILGHLASRHEHDIRKALLKLFKESLKPDADAMELSAVSYLLLLAYMSPHLLNVMTTDFVNTVTPQILHKLAAQFIATKPSAKHDTDSLINMVVHLVMRSGTGAYRMVKFLLEVAQPSKSPAHSNEADAAAVEIVQQTCHMVMDKLVIELQNQTQYQQQGNATQLDFLNSLQLYVPQLCRDVAESEGKRRFWLCKVLSAMASQCGEMCATEILVTILCTKVEPQQLVVFSRIMWNIQAKFPYVLPLVTDQAMQRLQSATGDHLNILTNFLQLVRWEQVDDINRRNLATTLWPHLETLASLLKEVEPEASLTMELLVAMSLPPKLSVAAVNKLCCSIITFFFQSLHLRDAASKSRSCVLCQRYLKDLSRYPTAQKTILRQLLAGVLSKEHSPALGAKPQSSQLKTSRSGATQCHLLESSRKHAESVILPQMHSTVFHAGVIGQGPRPPPSPFPYTKVEQLDNKELTLELLLCCSCQDNENGLSEAIHGIPNRLGVKVMLPHIARYMALLLIEYVAPDVMYNGIPWPEEEFMKVTVERDLLIQKKFEAHPILWDVMDLVAEGPGAMCYCSSILRGVAATLVTFWDGCRDKSASNAPKSLYTSVRLVQCMRKGGLLTEPLCYIDEIFSLLAPFEVCILLKNVWTFMKENPPYLDVEENRKNRVCEPRHLAALKNILHSNIASLGHIYHRFFNLTPADH